MTNLYDFVIIGSGASGSVLAYYLTQAGARCVMLEAGQEYNAATFPRNELLANARLYWGGGMDATDNANLLFLRGKVLGGGTVVNQALLDRFDDLVFDDWRARTGIAEFSSQAMTPHYDEIERHLALHTITRAEWNRNAELYTRGFDLLGYQWAPLRRGQSDCDVAKNDCMACLGGCRRDSKQSMLITFLRQARAQGLQVETGVEVSGVVHGKQHVTVHGVQQGQQHTWSARKAIVAAGTLGTNRLLLRSGFKDRLPALGERFFCHPQWMNLALFDDVVDAHKGALQAVKSDEPRFRQQGFKLENVFVGPIGVTMLIPGHGLPHQRYMEQYRHMASMEVCLRDVEPGQLRVNNKGRLRITKPIQGEDLRRGRLGVQVVRDIYTALGAREFITSNFNFSLHQMGGCAIGQQAASSVVNPGFALHGYPHIYVADGSIFPSAPGINPSLTIMANSHRASQAILAAAGATFTASTQEVAHG